MSSSGRLASIPEGDIDDDCSDCSDCSATTCILLSDGGKSANKTLSQGVDRKILAVLDCKFLFGQENLTILQICSRSSPSFPSTDQGQQQQQHGSSTTPSKLLASAVEQALARYRLSLEQKRELFSIIGWEFECLACGRRKTAEAYKSSSFVLWGSESPARVRLRSGPCERCKDEVRVGKRTGDIVTYTTNIPR
jgi:hypothetical protein